MITVAALDALNTAELTLPNSPLIPLHDLRPIYKWANPSWHLANAEKAYSMDVVNLDIYRAMGFALEDLGQVCRLTIILGNIYSV